MRRRMECSKLALSTVRYGSLAAVLTAKAANPEPSAAAQASAAARAEADLRGVLEATPDPRQGRKLFQICAECHGPHGAGEASGRPSEIAGQHPRVIAKELTDFRSGLRWYDPMEIIAGHHVLTHDSGHRERRCAQHTQLLEGARMDDLAGLADYMSRLGSSTGQPLQTGRHEDVRTLAIGGSE